MNQNEIKPATETVNQPVAVASDVELMRSLETFEVGTLSALCISKDHFTKG